MDLATLIGFATAFGAIAYAVALGGTHTLHYFADLPALAIVFGGTTGTVLVGFPMGEVIGMLKVTRHAFFLKVHPIEELIATIVDMSDKARKEGVLALQSVSEKLEDPFLKKGIMMCIDGFDPANVEKLLATEMEYITERHKIGVEVFELAGQLAPALGLTGTIMALIQLLSAMNDPTTIGPAMATAFVTTFYGCFVANVLCAPLAGKLRSRNKHELLAKGLILEGILAIQAGDNPRMVEQRLHAFIQPAMRKTKFT